MKTNTTFTPETTGEATYCPEDNKLRLYVGRVPRHEYDFLRSQGWTSTPKQNCQFVATWTPARRDTALAYGGGIIGDEDQAPAERAADRAERFSGYRDKRTAEAGHHADRYDAGPAAHGFQSQAKAERAAARHDRIADRAGDAWSKAEYWQRRTAGVISHALYKSTPAVRMGRIKELEAELRKERANIAERQGVFNTFKKIAAIEDADKQTKAAIHFTGNCSAVWADYIHPRAAEIAAAIRAEGGEHAEFHAGRLLEAEKSLYSLLTYERGPITGAEACALFFSDHAEPAADNDWTLHLELRLAYERQMIEAAGGMVSEVEMIPGGFIGSKQIYKVNKSNATGRVVSVQLMGTRSGFTRESGYKVHETRPALVTVNIERLSADAYRPPTDEELAKFNAERKAAKAAAPKKEKPPLINPTDADAERLQAIWNERARAEKKESLQRAHAYTAAEAENYLVKNWEPSTVCRITQAVYSANSKGGYARAETCNICGDAVQEPPERFHSYEKQAAERIARGKVICQVRTTSGGFNQADCVIVLTDKPQKELPAAVWAAPVPLETKASVAATEAQPEEVCA